MGGYVCMCSWFLYPRSQISSKQMNRTQNMNSKFMPSFHQHGRTYVHTWCKSGVCTNSEAYLSYMYILWKSVGFHYAIRVTVCRIIEIFLDMAESFIPSSSAHKTCLKFKNSQSRLPTRRANIKRTKKCFFWWYIGTKNIYAYICWWKQEKHDMWLELWKRRERK